MRKKIQDLAYARFQYEKPAPQFSTERLEFEVLQGETYRGSFSLTSVNGLPMRGIVYSSNLRMECVTPEFEGAEVSIPFEFHSGGLIEGDIQKGDFIIVCNGGEYDLSFVASVIRFYPQTSIGQIKNMFDFANLAQASYEEAFRIFTAPFFENILRHAEEKDRLLYRMVGGNKATLMGMEEFLIGIRKKKKVTFTIEEAEKQFSGITEDVQESIKIKKSQWGHLEVYITSDSEAVVPVKSGITTADFVGNYAEIEFIIRAEKLHAGNNYARLKLVGVNQTEICEICVQPGMAVQQEDLEEAKRGLEIRKWRHRERKQLLHQLTDLYLDFRLQQMVTGIWAKESGECLKRLKEMEPENGWYTLYQAQIFLINKQRQEAEWILDSFRRKEKEKDTPLYAFYLYICTLQEKEPSYVAKLFRQIQEIYRRNREDMRLFLIMLFLDPEWNQNVGRKLSAIKKRIAEGENSPVLYMEAYYLIKQNVYLLQEPDKVTMQILYWAAREHLLTKEVAEQVQKCTTQVRQFHPLWDKILKACYQVDAGRESLQAVCSFCVKWNRFSKEMFEWYNRGIQEELRIAGLYEAWLNCAGTEQIEQFPKSVMLYFRYRNNLDYKKQALLYASIVKHKDNQKSLYGVYQKSIEQFAREQLLYGRVDKNLAILYEEVLENLPLDKKLAEALADIAYTYQLICEDTRAERIVVLHHEKKREQVVPLVNQQAYIQIYSDDYCIMAEDARGVRYLPVTKWKIKKLMHSEWYIKDGILYAEDKLPFLIHYFDGKKTFHSYLPEDMPRLMKLMEAPEISDIYKRELKPQIIEYYYNSYIGAELDEYLSEVDYHGLRRGDRNKVLALMIARGIYDRVYEMLREYGNEQAAVNKLVMVAVQKILEKNYQRDEVVLNLCYTIFNRGKCNEIITKYLCRYFRGSIRELERLWGYAKEFELETTELEERFLTQLLYTEGYTEKMELIFKSYFQSKGQEMVLMAYLSCFSYQYLVKEIVLAEEFFWCLQEQILLKNPLNDGCRLAYLKWLVMQKSRSQEQDTLMEELLEEYLKRHMYFAFYQELPIGILRKYHLHDKVFLEYRTNPKNQVLINYCCNGPEKENRYVEECMEQMYEGIFVKPFVIFFGERIPYYIKTVHNGKTAIPRSGHIYNDLMAQGDESRYGMINDMMLSHQMQDDKTLQQLYMQYEERRQQVEDKFRLL